jgi:hypothetical protein
MEAQPSVAVHSIVPPQHDGAPASPINGPSFVTNLVAPLEL